MYSAIRLSNCKCLINSVYSVVQCVYGLLHEFRNIFCLSHKLFSSFHAPPRTKSWRCHCIHFLYILSVPDNRSCLRTKRSVCTVVSWFKVDNSATATINIVSAVCQRVWRADRRMRSPVIIVQLLWSTSDFPSLICRAVCMQSLAIKRSLRPLPLFGTRLSQHIYDAILY